MFRYTAGMLITQSDATYLKKKLKRKAVKMEVGNYLSCSRLDLLYFFFFSGIGREVKKVVRSLPGWSLIIIKKIQRDNNQNSIKSTLEHTF